MDEPLQIGNLCPQIEDHPAQLLDILRELIVAKRHAESYHTGMNLQANTMGSSNFRRALHGLSPDLRPVQTRNQQAELLGGHVKNAILDGRESERPAFQPFCLRIPMKPDGYSDAKPDRHSNLMPDAVPI